MATTRTAATLTRFPSTERSYVYRDQGTITIPASGYTLATGDVWNFFVIPAGTEIHAITIQNDDLGTAAPVNIGFAPVDGSSGTATAFRTAYAAGTAAAAGVTYMLATPVKVEKDSFCQGVFGPIDTPATEVSVTVALTGQLLGPK